MNDPAFRRRAGDGAVFTATKCPHAPGLAASCELPFGFVWTPMSPTDSAITIEEHGESLPPVLCLTCLAYLNLYASFDVATGRWTCPLCGAENVAPKEIFESTASDGGHSQVSNVLVSPYVEYRQRIGRDVPPNINTDDVCYYVLVMDGNLPLQEAQSVARVTEKLLQNQARRGKQVQLGLIVFDQVVSLYQLGLTGIASADICHGQESDEQVVERRTEMANRSYFTAVRAEQEVATLWLCMSAVYGVHVANAAGPNGTPQSDETAALSRKDQLRQRREARLKKQASGSDVTAPAMPMESPWTIAQRKESAPALRCTGEAIQCAMDLATFAKPLQAPRTSRILLFTNGCPNFGEGSIIRRDNAARNSRTAVPDVVDPIQLSNAMQYFELTAKDAIDSGIAMDAFCTGAELLGMPTYQALVEPSGGYALPHETFSSPQFERNMEYVVSQTHVSRSRSVDEPDSMNGLGPPTANELTGCLVDLRMSSFVTPTHVLVSGKVLYDDTGKLLPNERSAFAMSASLAAKLGLPTNNLPSDEVLASSRARLRLGRFDPLSTVSAMLQVNNEIQPDDRHAFFQCIVRYVEEDGDVLVTRVSTHRLCVAMSVHDFLDGMDEEVVPVLLGKEAVFRSIVGREEPEEIEAAAADTSRLELLAREAQRDLDATIHMISGAFRLLILEEGTTRSDRDLVETGGIGASPSSLDFAFPPELADALHRLFHLRRGSLLSPGPLKSADDRALRRSLFLRLPLEDCLCMMAPSLWHAQNKGSQTAPVLHLEPVPSDTLALWDQCIIAADHHDALFVYSGRHVLGPEYDVIRDQCKNFLLERSINRFPMPELHILTEGNSMSRRFTARLAPSHADPPEQQLAHFPGLASLSPSELTALRDKFRFYDASTDASFRRWFWEIASASSNARNEGMSLCQ